MKNIFCATSLAILFATQLQADGKSEFSNLYNMKQCKTSMVKSSLYGTGDFFVLQSHVDNPISLASWDGYGGVMQDFEFLVLNYDFKTNRINDWLMFGTDDKNYVDFSYNSNVPQGLIEDNNVIDSIAIDAKYDELRIKHGNDDFETVYTCELVSDGQTKNGNFVYFVDYIEAVFPNVKPKASEVKKKETVTKSKDYLFQVTSEGRLNAQPFHIGKSFEYFACDDVIGDYFGDWGINTLTLLADEYGVDAPDKKWCAVSQGKAGTMFGNMIKVSYYMDGKNFDDCVYRNNCTTRNSMDLQIKNGKIYFNSTVQRGADVKMACFSSGEIVNLKGCYAVN